MTRIAINGLGRIGRAAFKIILDHPELELVAINDISPVADIVYLLRHDSVYGKFNKDIDYSDDELRIDGKSIKVYNKKDPAELPWKEHEIEIVFECSGRFTKKEQMQKHLDAGAGHVILSAPADGGGVPTFIFGVNEPKAEDRLISAASCTTNCVAPLMEILGRRIGVKKALMTTVHAYTSSQAVVDMPDKDRRRGRAAAINFVPSSTGAARATALALPEYKGIFDGLAIRGPVPSGSIADITLITNRKTSKEEINKIFLEESGGERYKGILGIADSDMVSSDVIKDPRASVVDTDLTMVVEGDLVKIMSWYDNEWGYVNQMLRTGMALAKQIRKQEV